LREGDAWEDAALRLRRGAISSAPVIDRDGYLVAILNPSDLLQEMEIEVGAKLW
jgi:CBS domain-containing protein